MINAFQLPLGPQLFLEHKLRGVSPQNILFFADYDLTMAPKDPDYFDYAHLTQEQHSVLVSVARIIKHFFVVTARGSATPKHYLRDYGSVPNLSLASNSGHYVEQDIAFGATNPWVIPVPGYNGKEIRAVVDAIHRMTEKLAKEFDGVEAKKRELCGAAVYQMLGHKDSPVHTAFLSAAESLRAELPADLRDKIIYASKSLEINTVSSFIQEAGLYTRGYIDMKPVGMDKGLSVKTIYNRLMDKSTETPFIVVAGDSAPDYDMMTAVSDLVPLESRLFISVGRGLVSCDKAREAEGKAPLLDVVLDETQDKAINQFYGVMQLVADLSPDPTRRYKKFYVKSSSLFHAGAR